MTPNNAPHNALRNAVTGAIARGEATPILERRCYCPDDCRCHREANPPCGCKQHAARRTITSATGDRLRELAAAQRTIADVCEDAGEAGSGGYDTGYGIGQADAYRTAATQLETIADQEDAR